MCCLESGTIVQAQPSGAQPPSATHLASGGNFLQDCQPCTGFYGSGEVGLPHQGCVFVSFEMGLKRECNCITSIGTVLASLSQAVIQKSAILMYRKRGEASGSGEREFTSLQQSMKKAIENSSSPSDNRGLSHTIPSPEHLYATSLLFKESNESVSVSSQELFCYILIVSLLHYG